MISRRLVLAAVPMVGLARGADAAPSMTPSMTPAQRLETMIRMRGSTDGTMCAGWLDAVRSTFIAGEIVPFCRILAGTLSRFEKRGDLYEATVLEVAYYLHPETGAILDTFRFPGGAEPVAVPPYRAGPTKVRFSVGLDEWEEVNPAGKNAPSSNFVPKASVHLQRDIGVPRLDNGSLYLRSDEYGRVYPDRAAPPTIFYREWMMWRAAARDVLEGKDPSVPADFMYSALSSWRPWMKMGSIKGHTAENGRGAKLHGRADFPAELRDLMARKDPDILRDPARALG
jgi:hypothetical protein